jgi:hypothetical protein
VKVSYYANHAKEWVKGTPAYIRIREGEEHVLIQGNHYLLKDIVWLMANGSIAGEVIYKNPHRVTNKTRN